VEFYLGVHRPAWLATAAVPLFVSHRTLSGRRSLPRAATCWALDSGGFSELNLLGGWQTTPAAYVAAVRRYAAEIGRLRWAAQQDWMCEPSTLGRTGLTVADHQQRTVDNFLDLRMSAPELPFVPVLQGWRTDDYLRCAERFERAGIDLASQPVLGVGSVCRRNEDWTLQEIFLVLHLQLRLDNLHGFGVKGEVLCWSQGDLMSADSMAWSFAARRQPFGGSCGRRSCSNCLHYGLEWRRRLLRRLQTFRPGFRGAMLPPPD
jgi:hypothetical protein